MIYVIFMDICAIYYASTDHEYDDTAMSSEFNLYVTYITFCFDAVVVLYSIMIFMAYISRYCCCFKEKCSESKVMFMIGKCCYIPFFYLMLGVDRSDEVWVLGDPDNSASRDQLHNLTTLYTPVKRSQQKQPKNNTIHNRRDVWIYISLFYASLFCVSSHIGYIFVAWLTDPSRTSSIALLALVILLYFFLMYREIYDNNKSITTGSSCKEKWKQSVHYIPPCAVVMFILEFIVSYLKICKEIASKCCKKDANGVLNNGQENGHNRFQNIEDSKNTNEEDSSGFSLKAFLIALSWGPVIVVLLGVAITVLLFLPIPSLEIASYLQNIVHIVLILVSALVSYRILLFKDSSVTGFPIKFRPNYDSLRKPKYYNRADEASVEDEATVEDEPIVQDGYGPTGEIRQETFKVVVKK